MPAKEKLSPVATLWGEGMSLPRLEHVTEHVIAIPPEFNSVMNLIHSGI
jgi:hypothetical protein